MNDERQATPQDLEATRRRLKLSRAQAAAILGCSEATVRNWELGSSTPRGSSIAQAIASLESVAPGPPRASAAAASAAPVAPRRGSEGAFGARVAAFREAYHVDQSELAQLVGVDRSAISKWERGESTPRARARKRFEALSEMARRVSGAARGSGLTVRAPNGTEITGLNFEDVLRLTDNWDILR